MARIGENKKNYSFVLKNNTGNQSTKGTGNVVMGTNLVGAGSSQTVLGQNNAPSQTDIFQVGNAIDGERSNAFRIDENGIAYIGGGLIYMLDNNTRKEVVCVINGMRMPVRFKDMWNGS